MDIVIVGAQKAGTTWLFSMMSQQPRVGSAFAKEIHYFDNIYNNAFKFNNYKKIIMRRRPSIFSNNPRLDKYIDYAMNSKDVFTDQWYKNIFLMKPVNRKKMDRGLQLCFIDVSPNYMTMPEKAVAHMARVLPDIEPILIIRDPIKRMVSGVCGRIARDLGRQTLTTVTDVWLTRVINEGQIPRGSYSTAIPLFRKYFRNLQIIPFGRIPADPSGLLIEIEKKYDLDHINYKNLEGKRNARSDKYNLNDAVLSHIERVCEVEYEYLRVEFGSDFLNQI